MLPDSVLEHIREDVRTMPPLTSDQRSRIAVLFGGDSE